VRALVAGGTGVLGRLLVPALLDAGYDVRAFARHAVSQLPAAAEFIAADLLESDLAPLVDGCDVVIHAATAIPRDRAVPGAWDLNTRLRTVGTRRLLEAGGTRRYIQQSITMAYADGGDQWLDESWPFDPSPNRASVVDPVREMESLVRASSADWIILRGGSFLPIAVPPVIPCDGCYYVSPIHPADMASAFVLAAEHAPSHATYNVTADPFRFTDLPAKHAFDPTKPCPASHRCTSAAARRDLAWQPIHSIYSSTPADVAQG